MSQIVYEFGGLRLDPAQRALTGENGEPVVLAPRLMDALLLLVARRGQLLDKSALVEALWPDAVVTENSLDQVMSQLRRALASASTQSPSISTERGRGFRFVAPVKVVHAGGSEASASSRTPVSRLTQDTQAYQLFLQARALSTRPSPDNLRASFELARRAIELDPGFTHALAFVALLRTVFVAFDIPMPDALALAERDARRALDVDPTLARGNQALGNVLVARGAWNEAAIRYEAACRNEEDPDARVTRIWQLTQSVGHLQLSLRQAAEVDSFVPSQPLGAIASALASYLLGLDRDARRHADAATALGWPRNNAGVCDIHSQLALRAQRYREAAEWMTLTLSAPIRAAGGAEVIAQFCSSFETSVRPGAVVSAIHALVERVAPETFGMLDRRRALLWLAMLGALDEAFDLANRSLDHFALSGMVGIQWGMLWMPEMRAFRSDRRFQGIVARLRLHDYWTEHGPPDGHRLCEGTLICEPSADVRHYAHLTRTA